MNANILNLISPLYKHNQPSQKEIDLFLKILNFKYPEDYLDIIKEHNGLEGSIGSSYIAVWPISEVIEINSQYAETDKMIADKYFIFGSNSGIYNYAFDKSAGSILELDMYDESYSIHCGSTMLDFLLYLKSKA